jgi:CIC family chloride channel protein
VGKLFNQWLPSVVTQPGAFVVVGMAGFFTAVSNTPISTIIFVSEMTNSYHLLLPSLLVCSVAYLGAQRYTIFHRQVKSKIDSQAHAGDFFVDLLQSFTVKDVLPLVKKVRLIPRTCPLSNSSTIFPELPSTTFRSWTVKSAWSASFPSMMCAVFFSLPRLKTWW